MSQLVKDNSSYPVQAFRLPDTSGYSFYDTIAVSAASAANAAGPLPAGMYYFCSTVDCHVVQGTGGAVPTATTSHTFIPAYTPMYFYVNAGQRVAAIAAAGAGAGTLFLSRMP